jgi:hypothetical protein
MLVVAYILITRLLSGHLIIVDAKRLEMCPMKVFQLLTAFNRAFDMNCEMDSRKAYRQIRKHPEIVIPE